ncbi:MAG TPA: FUSC family protein [Cellulomonas sp.]
MRRLSLLLDLARPAQLRAALHVNRVSGTLGGAVRCGLSVAAALAALALAGRHDLAGFATLGALASLYGRAAGYPWRARLMVLAALSLTATVAVTSAVVTLGAPVSVEIVVLALLAAVATAGTALLRTGPPGAIIIVFAAGAGTGTAASGLPQLLERAGATAVGAALAVVICCAGAVLRRRGRWIDVAPGRVSSVAPGTGPTTAPDVGPAGAASAVPAAPARPGATAARQQVPAARPARARRPDPRGILDALRTAPPLRSVAASALLVGTATLLAAGAAALAGRGHPAWAAMGATAVLQGAHVQHMGVRAIQRATGTACGVALAFPLLGADLGFTATAVTVVVLQVVTEVVVARHYGLAMLTITPMALLMTTLGADADPSALVLDRAVDTAIGALVGVLAAVAASRPDGSPAGSTTAPGTRPAPTPLAPAAGQRPATGACTSAGR